MKIQVKSKVVILSVVTVCLVLAFIFFFGSWNNVSVEDKRSGEEQIADGAKKKRLSLRKNKRKSRKMSAKKEKRSAKISRRKKVKVNDKEEIKLTAAQQKILDTIQDASDNDNKDALIRIVQDLQKMEGWPNFVPQSIRLAAIEALQWFGSDCLPEAVGFLSDPDEEVVQCALAQFEDAVEDTDKSDKERASILSMAATVVNDSDTMDSMLFELNNMRNSVAANTIKFLWENGNATVKSLLPDAIESVTGEEGIDTVEKIDAWLQENPDDED